MIPDAPNRVGFVGCAGAGRLVKVGIVGNAPETLRIKPCPFCDAPEHLTVSPMSRPIRDDDEVDVLATTHPARVKLPDDLPERILAALTSEDRPLNDVAIEIGANHKTVRKRVDALVKDDPSPLILTPSRAGQPTLLRLPH